MSSPVGRKSTQEGALKRGKKTPNKKSSPSGKTIPQKGASPGERKSQVDFNKLKSSDEFKQWFWTENNAIDIILAVNDYAFKKKQFEASFVRYEKSPAHVYGVVINMGDLEDPFWKNIHELGLRLVKVGFTQKETIKGNGNRMEFVMDKVNKDLDFKVSTIFSLIVDFTTERNLREEEEFIRRKVGIELDKGSAKYLKLPIPTEWVVTTQINIDMLKEGIEEKKKEQAENRKMYTTKDVEECDGQTIEDLVKQIHAEKVEVIDNKVVISSKSKSNPSIPEKNKKFAPLHKSKEP